MKRRPSRRARITEGRRWPIAVMCGAALLAIAVASLSAVARPAASAVAAVSPASAASVALRSSAAKPAPTAVAVKLEDTEVFSIYRGHGGQTAEQRARAASDALKTALASESPDQVRNEPREGVDVVFAGNTPIVQLYPEDAAAAGDSSLEVHAATVAMRVRAALHSEKKRNAIATTVFSISLIVFLGLITLYVLRKVGDFSRRSRAWIDEHPDRIPSIRLRKLEVVRPAALRGGLLISLTVGKWLLQIGLVYTWLLVVLSLFAPTRGYTERLSGYVLAPLSALAARIASSLPLLLVATIAGVAVWVLLRFVGLFFDAVSRGETRLAWIPADLALPTGVLLRVGIVLAALVFAAPIVTGDTEGPLARVGTVIVVALGLASTPLLSSLIAGTSVVFLRRLRVGDYTEFGGRFGRVRSVGLLEVLLEDGDGCEVRVPQVLAFFHPTRIFGQAPRISVEVTVEAGNDERSVLQLLLAAVQPLGENATIEALGFDARGTRFRVSLSSAAPDARSRVCLAAAEALKRGKVTLARVAI